MAANLIVGVIDVSLATERVAIVYDVEVILTAHVEARIVELVTAAALKHAIKVIISLSTATHVRPESNRIMNSPLATHVRVAFLNVTSAATGGWAGICMHHAVTTHLSVVLVHSRTTAFLNNEPSMAVVKYTLTAHLRKVVCHTTTP